jgi:AraC-like DNA-binding protein
LTRAAATAYGQAVADGTSRAGGGRASASARVVKVVAGALAARGVDVPAALGRLGVDPRQLEDPDARLPHATMVALWESVGELAGDELIGFRLGQEFRSGSVLELVARHCASFGESLAALDRYLRLMHDGARLPVERDGAVTRVLHRNHAPPPHPRQIVELLLTAVVATGRRNTGRDWAPLAVEFRHAAPAGADELARWFRCPVRFGAPASLLVLPTALLDAPNLAADPELAPVLARHADDLVARLPAHRGIVDEVRWQLDRAIADGAPELAAVARRMAMSPRALQRALQQAGTGFHALLDRARRDWAVRQVEDRRLPLAEVAFALGYSELSAFHRAFRRWTGRPPGEYRRAAR